MSLSEKLAHLRVNPDFDGQIVQSPGSRFPFRTAFTEIRGFPSLNAVRNSIRGHRRWQSIDERTGSLIFTVALIKALEIGGISLDNELLKKGLDLTLVACAVKGGIALWKKSDNHRLKANYLQEAADNLPQSPAK